MPHDIDFATENARLRGELVDLRSRVAGFAQRHKAEVADFDAAMVAIFGAPADQIEVAHIDHLCPTLTPPHVERLLRAVGGPWAAILDRIAERRADAGTWKDRKADAPTLRIFDTSGKGEG